MLSLVPYECRKYALKCVWASIRVKETSTWASAVLPLLILGLCKADLWRPAQGLREGGGRAGKSENRVWRQSEGGAVGKLPGNGARIHHLGQIQTHPLPGQLQTVKMTSSSKWKWFWKRTLWEDTCYICHRRTGISNEYMKAIFFLKKWSWL